MCNDSTFAKNTFIYSMTATENSSYSILGQKKVAL